MKRRTHHLWRSTLSLLGTVGLLAGSFSMTSTSASAQTSSAQPCLTGDPFQLNALKTKLSQANPPSGVQRVNRNLTVEFITTGVLTDEAPIMPNEPFEAGDDDPYEREPVPAATATFRVFNTLTLNEFRVVMQANAVSSIRDCYERNNLLSGNAPSDYTGNIDAPAPQRSKQSEVFTPFGWSNSDDNRQLKTNTSQYPLRTISQFSGLGSNQDSNCTGTFVGPRHLITAAHCINREATNVWYTTKVTPARNGTGSGSAPYGSSVIRLNPSPPVESWYWTFEEWRDPNQTKRTRWDIGMIVVPDRLGDTTYWMGVASRTASYLKNIDSYNRGYPNCNGDGATRGNAPAGCQVARMYGDPGNCGARWFKNLDSAGWSMRYEVKCDISAGHSGSPVYHYEYSAQHSQEMPVLSAVIITEECFTCSNSSYYVNRVRRVTPSVIDNFVALREIFN
ncbi:trypsin-like serine peptidase [Herpetosiphon giganteus]|uniref:trypsin-like serine peptidase n=1 Tax=Herpetosiphon giganteus TaxID=2029754 RepID=UPI00195E1E3C|nr:trypsin-like serine protease [Herpetosiphon giganteus]MBM7844325.1 V8-like Glu-specific endopeptidase [Herpetosiphon giganteus]